MSATPISQTPITTSRTQTPARPTPRAKAIDPSPVEGAANEPTSEDAASQVRDITARVTARPTLSVAVRRDLNTELPPAIIARVDGLPPATQTGLAEVAGALSADLAGGSSPSIAGRWGEVVSGVELDGVADVNALVQWVLRASYLQTTEDLRMYAEKVKFYNGMKEKIRNELTRARNALSGTAGMPEESMLPAVFTPVNIDDTFVPTAPASESASSGLTAEQQAEMEAQRQAFQERQQQMARYDQLMAEWQNTPPNERTIDGTAIKGSGDAGKDKMDDDDVLQAMLDEGGQEWINAVVEWFNGLTPEHQQALAEKWQEDGMTFRAHVTETHWVNESYTHEQNRTLPAGTDPASWLANECHRAIAKAADGIGEVDNGSSLKLDDMDFSIAVRAVTIEEPADKPQELVELERTLGFASAAGSTSSAYEVGEPCTTKAHLDAYIKGMEEKLSSVGDDAQLANVDLQNMLQKQQQTLQMMSNIAKMLHDTAMAVIRKVGG